MGKVDHLANIVARKRREVERRRRFAALLSAGAERAPEPFPRPEVALRRVGDAVRAIAEIKTRSPSAGLIRAREPGGLPAIARGYERAGAAAISVLCDGPGFGGTPLDLRRVSQAVSCPLLFKEFVVDVLQLDQARAMGASLVLLLACVLSDEELRVLSRETQLRGMQPVIEAADAVELARALRVEVPIVGVNARDLHSFQVDPGRAAELVDSIPSDRVAVFMSGVRSRQDMLRVRATRADAVLVGEGLMRAPDPGERLREWLE